jgi:hypothetical protein
LAIAAVVAVTISAVAARPNEPSIKELSSLAER